MKKKSKYFYQYRSSIDGHFCSKAYAERNPSTTQRHRVKRK